MLLLMDRDETLSQYGLNHVESEYGIRFYLSPKQPTQTRVYLQKIQWSKLHFRNNLHKRAL